MTETPFVTDAANQSESIGLRQSVRVAGVEEIPRKPRMDPAGRPLEGRRRQALLGLVVLLSWFACLGLIFWATRGGDPSSPAVFMAGMTVIAWLGAEATWRSQVWTTSAMAIRPKAKGPRSGETLPVATCALIRTSSRGRGPWA